MVSSKGFSVGKVGVLAERRTVAGGPSRLGDYFNGNGNGCPAGYIKNLLGVCTLPPIPGPTYFVQTLAGARRK